MIFRQFLKLPAHFLLVVKTKQKVSGQFKTAEGALQYATLQSIIQTVRKRGLVPLVALQAVAG